MKNDPLCVVFAPMDLEVDGGQSVLPGGVPWTPCRDIADDILPAKWVELDPKPLSSLIVPEASTAAMRGIAMDPFGQWPAKTEGAPEDKLVRADCVIFPVGVAVIRLFLRIKDARTFLAAGGETFGDDSAPTGERAKTFDDELSEGIFVYAKKALAELGVESGKQLSKRSNEVDWVYTVVETGGYIDDNYASCAAQQEAYSDECPEPLPLELGREDPVRLWIGWSTTQIESMEIAEEYGVSAKSLADIFTIRCACWKLLTRCRKRCLLAFADVEAAQRRSVADRDIRRRISELRIFGNRLLSSCQPSVWTVDTYLIRILKKIDEEWELGQEVEATRYLLDGVNLALLSEREELADERAERLNLAALVLAALSFLSAVSDTYTQLTLELPHSALDYARHALALAIPVAWLALVIVVLRMFHGGAVKPE